MQSVNKLLVQSQQQNKLWNMFKFSDKNTQTIHHRFSYDFREGIEDEVVSVFLLVTLNMFNIFF